MSRTRLERLPLVFVYLMLFYMMMAVLMMGCSNANLPRTTIMGVQVGGGSVYCTGLSAGVGAVGGGLLGGFFAPASASSGGAPAAGWTTMMTFAGAALGGIAGYSLCGPTTSATKASEPNPNTASLD